MPSASAQSCSPSGRYRIIDLGALPGSGTLVSRARGLNELAVVVGTSGPPLGPTTPFIWSPPNGAYGLSPSTLHDLTAFSGVPDFKAGSAEDLNDAGVVAGSRNFEIATAEFVTRAFVWDFSSGSTPTTTTLGVFCGEDENCPEEEEECGDDSFAAAVTEDDPPLVIGTAETPCNCTSLGSAKKQEVGFAWVLGDDEDDLSRLEPLNVGILLESSNGLDASEASLGRGVGRSTVCATATECTPQTDGVVWTSLGSTASPSAVEKIFGEVETRSINNDGLMAGWGRLDGLEGCLRRALVWDDQADILANLHDDAVPSDGEEFETFANAINAVDPCDRVQVVGGNESEQTALLWERDHLGDWTRIELLDEVGPCGTYGWTNLREATDINDEGQICGFGVRNGEIRAFLLVCRSDLDADGYVAGFDLGAVLAAAGPCVDCPEDLDGSGVVDGADYGLVLADWSGDDAPCGRPGWPQPEASCPSTESLAGAGGSPIVAALALLGFATIDDFVVWAAEASQEQVASVHQFLIAYVENGGEA